MAQLLTKPYPFPCLKFDGSKEELEASFKAQDEALEKLYQESLALQGSEIVGCVISFPVADGKAWYRVVKDKPLTLQWIDFGDSYRVDYIMIRGLRRKDVERILHLDQALHSLFQKADEEE